MTLPYKTGPEKGDNGQGKGVRNRFAALPPPAWREVIDRALGRGYLRRHGKAEARVPRRLRLPRPQPGQRPGDLVPQGGGLRRLPARAGPDPAAPPPAPAGLLPDAQPLAPPALAAGRGPKKG